MAEEFFETNEQYTVCHKSYGKGKVLGFDEKYIHVQFGSDVGKKTFVFPECFPRYLQAEETAFLKIVIEAKKVAAENKDKSKRWNKVYEVLNPIMKTSGSTKRKHGKNGPVKTTYIRIEQSTKAVDTECDLLIDELMRRQRIDEKKKSAQPDEKEKQGCVEKESSAEEKKNKERLQKQFGIALVATLAYEEKKSKEELQKQAEEKLKKETEATRRAIEELRLRNEQIRKEAEKRRQATEQITDNKSYEELAVESIQKAEAAIAKLQKNDVKANFDNETGKQKTKCEKIKVFEEKSPEIDQQPDSSVAKFQQQNEIAQIGYATVSKRKSFLKELALFAVCLLLVVGYRTYNTPREQHARELAQTGQIKTAEGIYKGEAEHGVINGYGTFVFDNGMIYEGNWEKNIPTGAGVLTMPDETVISGTFAEEEITSASVATPFKGGTIYRSITDGVMDDAIEIKWDDGTDFVGAIEDDNATGIVKYSNGDEYKGNLYRGYRTTGTYLFADGSVIEGEWYDNLLNNDCKITTAEGNVIKSKFNMGAMVGEGTVTINDELFTYTFPIVDGISNGQITVESPGATYVGTYLGTSLSGNGTITFADGDKYVGDIMDGQKSGNGTYTWASGEKYDGEWSNDTMQGTGIYYFNNYSTDRLVGNFTNGRPDGTLVYYTNNDTKYITYWDNGNHTGSANG